jgi:ABC-type lipoprotein export system ATPase subunit
VEYPARLLGSLEVYSPAVERLLEDLGLAELADRPPNETSIGQQQRAALARALVLGPTVLLADEPTSHQDAGWRDAVWQLLLRAAAEGTACLVATHEEEAAQYATRVVRVVEGTLVEEL